MCPSLACTPSTGPHASPPIKIHPVLLTQPPSFDLRLALFFEEPFIRFAYSGWCPVLAARGVWVVLHTLASLGVPHHPPLTLTPLGLASQDFRLASGALFSPAECNLRGTGEGEFLTAQYRYAQCGITPIRGVLVPCWFQPFKGIISHGTATIPFEKR